MIIQVLSYTKQLLGGLAFLAHKGVVHADIKPDNLVVNQSLAVLKVSLSNSVLDGIERGAFVPMHIHAYATFPPSPIAPLEHPLPITPTNLTQQQICDFGSAMRVQELAELGDAPYLQSRFYRAPENVLGYDPRVRANSKRE